MYKKIKKIEAKRILSGIGITAVLSLGLFSTQLSATSPEATITHSQRSLGETIQGQTKEKFFYNKGVSDGIEEGRRMGYSDAMKDAERSIKKYKKYIKALEAGKYLSKKSKITPPRIYQERRNGRVSVVVKGCNIEGELSPHDILMFPSMDDGGSGGSSSGYSSSETKSAPVSDSVFLAGVDRRKSKPTPTGSLKKATFKTFEDTSFYRKLFRNTGLPFSIMSDKKIRVMFRSNKEAESFIRRHGLTQGKDYR